MEKSNTYYIVLRWRKRGRKFIFYAFVWEIINKPSCYSCEFASKRRVSDFAIGDFWGIEKVLQEIKNTGGALLLNVNSEKVLKYLRELRIKWTIGSLIII